MIKKDGFVLILVLVVVIMLSLLTTLVLNLALNHRMQADKLGKNRIIAYNRANAGVVDATWRLSHPADPASHQVFSNATSTTPVNMVGAPNTTTFFNDDNWDPAPYYFDLESGTSSATRRVSGDNIDDAKIDISAKSSGPGGKRTITACGYDDTVITKSTNCI